MIKGYVGYRFLDIEEVYIKKYVLNKFGKCLMIFFLYYVFVFKKSKM